MKKANVLAFSAHHQQMPSLALDGFGATCHPLIFLQMHTSAILLSNFQGQSSSSNENYVGLQVMECIKSIQMHHATKWG